MGSNYDQIAMVLQGGGALGAYQAGVYEALAAEGYEPDWYAGISIGAVNAAIMAGNEPSACLGRLHEFWDEVSSCLLFPAPSHGTEARTLYNMLSAEVVSATGAPGFFRPRFPPAIFYPRGSSEALSVYDSSPLRSTLERLVDFDRINAKRSRLSLGATNIGSGNMVYFDNLEQKIGPEHVMASGALPPGLPPVDIDGELYWDGGLVSNTPLRYVLDSGPLKNTLIFQLDLFSARGKPPRDLFESEERRKDIVYSSRTRLNTDTFHKSHALRQAIRDLYDALPEDKRNEPRLRQARALGDSAHNVAIVHLIYRRKVYETQAKDYEFSRPSMIEHWKAGFEDAMETLSKPAWNDPAPEGVGLRVFDCTRDQEEKAR